MTFNLNKIIYWITLFGPIIDIVKGAWKEIKKKIEA